MITFAAIMPHPPVSIPGIGSDEEMNAIKKTLEAFEQLRKELEDAKPDVVIVISPHAALEPYGFVVNSDAEVRGSFAEFGLDHVLEFKNDIEIAELLEYACHSNEVPVHLHGNFLDHGSLVPLYHLLKNFSPHVVQLSISLLSLPMHYWYGEIISRVCKDSSKRIAVVASGDLSHRLSQNAPAGYSSEAKFFDQRMIENLGQSNLAAIIGLRQEYTEDAAECGLRAFVILLGILHGKKYDFQLLNYEAPFGIGYLTARLF